MNIKDFNAVTLYRLLEKLPVFTVQNLDTKENKRG